MGILERLWADPLRAELDSSSRPRSSIKLAGILDAWRRGNGAHRRQLLMTLFDGLVVRNQLIVEWIPRRDRAAEVIAIMDSATGDQWREGRDSNPGSGNTRSSA